MNGMKDSFMWGVIVKLKEKKRGNLIYVIVKLNVLKLWSKYKDSLF